MTVKLYVEGGGDYNTQKAALREGFRGFFDKAGFRNKRLKIVACGGRAVAYKDFRIALSASEPDTLPMLLVDSEAEVTANSVWEHLRSRPGDMWTKPHGASEENTYLMVQCMEAWFIADRDSLRAYYGKDFHLSLGENQNVEFHAKASIQNALLSATRRTQKGEYRKIQHASALLKLIDPRKIRTASKHACRLLDKLAKLFP